MTLFTPPLLPHIGPQDSSTLAPLLRVLQSSTACAKMDARMQRYQIADAKLKNATSYRDWLKAAEELDKLEGNDVWKSDPVSDDYDYKLLETRLEDLEDARLNCDVGRMLFLIRTTLSRNLGDMGNLHLYRHSHTGTKHLIEKYISSCLTTINTLITTPKSPTAPPHRHILETLIATRQAFGRTALLLSGGATFGMSHIGVLKALIEVDLLPRVISGASAGSIVASVLCTHSDDDIPRILEDFPYGDLAVFDDENNPENIFQRLARFLKIGAWIDINHLIRVMKGLLGDITFQEAYNRTRRILNICVSSASVYELPRLLNYISSPNVLVWSAVAASCSVPFLFSSSPLLIKDPKTGLAVPWNPSPQRWIDGSVDNDLPMTRLSEMFNVNHFIVSQVNPHVIPFLNNDEYLTSSTPTLGGTLAKLAMSETMHRMTVLAELGICQTSLTKAKAVLSQKYSGDITILPEISYKDFGRILSNPSPEFMIRAALAGERATWPKMSRIQNHCAIELALDRAIHMLRTRVVFSPSQADLRLIMTSRSRGRRRRVRSSDGMPLRGNMLQGLRARSEDDEKRNGVFNIRKNSETTAGPPPATLQHSNTCPPVKTTNSDSESLYTSEESEDQQSTSDSEIDEDAKETRRVPMRISLPLPSMWSSTGGPFNLFMTPTPSNPTSPELKRGDIGYTEAGMWHGRRMSVGSFDFGLGLGIRGAKSAEELRQMYCS